MALPEDVTPEELVVLMRRAAKLKAPLLTAEEETAWVAEFAVGDERYAIPLESLRAAMPLKAVTPIPLSAPHLLGILRFQGEIITAFSLSSLLGGRGWQVDPAVLLVVDPGWGRPVALDCEQIPKVTSVPMAALEQARLRRSEITVDVALEGMRQLKLIDLKRLLDRRAGARDAR